MTRTRLPGRQRRIPALRLVGTLLATGLLVYLLSQQGWGDILAALRHMPWWRIVLAFALTMVSRLAVSGRWHVLLRSAGVPIPVRQSVRITFAGLFASNFLPTTIGGDVVRLGGALRMGYDRMISLASLIVDRLVGMAGMAMALIPVLFELPDILRNLFGRGRAVILPGFGIVPLATTQSGWAGRLWAKGRMLFARLLGALGLWIKHPLGLLVALGFTGIHMGCIFTSIWLLLPGMGEHMPLWQIGGLWSVTYFITLLPVSINGLGVQELAVTGLYAHFGGISAASSLTLALLVRVLPMFASLPGAFFLPGMMAGEEAALSPVVEVSESVDVD